MFLHYIKIALRNFYRDRGYSLINLIGLALAVAFSLLFVLWVQYEYKYESSHVHRKHIYRVLTTEYVGGAWVKRNNTPGPLGQALQDEFPVIENSTFLHVAPSPGVLVYNEQPFSAIRGEAGSRFFEIFTFQFLQGTPATAFEGERPIVISEDFARKVFGDNSSDAIGKPIYDRWKLWNNVRSDPPYIVTAVVRIPENTHIRFDVLLNAEKTSQLGAASRSWRAQGNYTTFVQMAPKATFNNELRTLMADFLTKYLPNNKLMLIFQPFTDIHLHSGVTDTNLSGEFGEPRYIFIFLTVALFVLLIGVINYVNLSIARGANRSREAGVRKITGAYRRELTAQFLSESMLWSFVAMIIAFGIAELITPWFSGITGAALTIRYTFRTFLTALSLSLFTGLLAGSYSAFYLTSFNPILGLKGGSLTGSKSVLRKTLLTVQLAISAMIILCTGIVYSQLHYIQNKDIGFDRYHVIGLNTGLWYVIEDFKTEVLKIANVEAVSIASHSPIDISEGLNLNWEGKSDEAEVSCNLIFGDWDYAQVFGLQMASGRFIPATRTVWGQGGDVETFYLVLNETAAKTVGMEHIFETKVLTTNVVGVVKDFHFRSFQEKITPLIIRYGPETSGKVFIRISPYNQRETLNQIKSVFERFKTDNPFEYFYMEDEYRNMYQKEFRLGHIFLYFSLLSIFISIMGVFSLVAFMVEQRTKEIAIRKINGATTTDIMALFAREFTILTVVASAVASPFAWFAMYRWLQNYQYHADIGLWLFIAVPVLLWLLTMFALLTQIYKAARRNPVVSLKYE